MIEAGRVEQQILNGHLARRRAQIAGLRSKRLEEGGRKKVPFDDEPVAIEAPAILLRDQPGEAAPACLRQPIGGGNPGRVQPVLVEPAIADDGIAGEEFFLAEDLRGANAKSKNDREGGRCEHRGLFHE